MANSVANQETSAIFFQNGLNK